MLKINPLQDKLEKRWYPIYMRNAVQFTQPTYKIRVKIRQSRKFIFYPFIGGAKVDKHGLKVRKACGVGEFLLNLMIIFICNSVI